MTARIAAVAGWLSGLPARARQVVRQAAIRLEAPSREAIGMPAAHPELLIGRLRQRDARWLADVSAQLWPNDEYAAIVRDTRPETGP